MKSSKNLNFVPEFFKKANVKKLILILYCVVPLLVVSIGFASWLIVGSNTDSTASGTFYASDIINSYDYIVPENNSTTQNIEMYPTAFVDENGNFVSTVSIAVNFKINLKKCYELTKKEENGDTLHAIFTLSFVGGEALDAFFTNLSATVKIGGNTISTTETTLSGANAKIVNSREIDSTSGANGYRTQMDLSNLTNAAQDSLTLNLTYQLKPTGDSKATDYQTIYNTITDSKYRLMMDVTINDYAGDTTN